MNALLFWLGLVAIILIASFLDDRMDGDDSDDKGPWH